MIDTHSHIYLPQFDDDRDEVVRNAIDSGVEKIFLPNIDSTSIEGMLGLCKKYPRNCFPMMGLHPSSVKDDFEREMDIVESWLEKEKFIAVGECGIDLYWDKTYGEQQKEVFAQHIKWAIQYDLSIVIHARDSFNEIYEVLEKEWNNSLKGVFHSFTGNLNDVDRINNFGFMFGINGIVTFKNSDLKDVVKHIDISKIILETDSPYLSPVPKRGKRNESKHLVYIAEVVAEIFKIKKEEISDISTNNAKVLFNSAFE